MKVTNVVLLAVINSNLKSAEAIRRAALQLQKAVEDDEEELPDSSTTAAALATESNVEHIKHMEEKLDTGVLDGAADESDRILRKKNKKGKGGKKSKNMFVKDDGCSCPSSDTTDTAMELEEAKAKIAELEKKLGQCDANGEDVRYYGSPDDDYYEYLIPEDDAYYADGEGGGGGGAASFTCPANIPDGSVNFGGGACCEDKDCPDARISKYVLVCSFLFSLSISKYSNSI